ncbi:MAG: alpha amylase C-terminal domain-containing protein [Clostridium sp.]|nr:alpha amylase C-terminal domain-containing protein [Clostridium sp.]
MTKKLYRYMNWREMEGIIYSDTDEPGELLGPHTAGSQTLVQVFLPSAEKISVMAGEPEKEYPMELADEEGYFAVLLPGKKQPEYRLKVTDKDSGSVRVLHDAYAYPASECLYAEEKKKGKAEDTLSDPAQIRMFHMGTQYHAWKYMGAHRAVCRNVTGVLFRVWAPEAVRVSVIGAFNGYDGRVHQMNRSTVTDLFELFIPDLEGEIGYQYEIRKKNGDVIVKSDPYATKLYDEKGEEEARYLIALLERGDYRFKDGAWKKKQIYQKGGALSICEISAEELFGEETSETKRMTALKTKAKELRDAGYTHVSLQHTMLENTDNHSVHETVAFYAAGMCFARTAALKETVDVLHEEGLSVIFEWAPGCFSKAEELLAEYDGSCLYEHLDGRQGFHNRYQVKLFQYARPEVQSFLLSTLTYLIEELHADGIRVCDTSFMLYLDYGKPDGEWLANLYGGNENLDAIAFLKHAVSMVKNLYPDVLMITDEASGWQNLTRPLAEDGFGFDYKWNYALVNDLLRYLTIPYGDRRNAHHELTLSYLYMYKERFINALSADYILRSDCGLACMNTENAPLRAAAARLLPAYLMLHPGAKLFNPGFLPEGMEAYLTALNQCYLTNPALYAWDDKEDGFEWMNAISANESVLLFLRKCSEQTLLIGVNFSDQAWLNHKSGVPADGKYKEIFNTDSEEFGGSGIVNARVIKAKKDECDTREYSVRIHLAPMSAAVFAYVPYTEKELSGMQEKEEERRRRQAEAQRKKEQLKKKKEKIRASLKEELARKIAQAEAEIASGSERK